MKAFKCQEIVLQYARKVQGLKLSVPMEKPFRIIKN